MRQLLRITLLCLITCLSWQLSAQTSYYKFIENKGQHPEQVLFSVDLENGTIFFEKDRFTYSLKHSEDVSRISNYHGKQVFDQNLGVRAHAYEMVLEGSICGDIQGKSLQRGTTSYFRGNDPEKWGSACRAYAEILYKELYEGIDLRVYANDFLLKFEYIVKAGADPSVIRQVYNHTDQLKLKDGKVIIQTNAGLMTEQAPVSFQKVNGFNELVSSEYAKKKNVVTYSFPKGYDGSKTLVIDPELVFSTYSGSTSDNFGYTASFDNEGFLYSGSSAFGTGYPTTLGSFEEDWGTGTVDIALSKVDTTGTFLVWSAYLGGSNNELPHSIMVNENNELYVLGTCGSSDFPTTANAYDTEFNGGDNLNLGTLGMNYDLGADIVLARISEDGSELLGSTFIGGAANDGLNFGSDLRYNYADEVRGEIQLDEFGNVFVVSSTYSTDFPVSGNAAQTENSGGQDAVAFMMSPDLSNLEWSTYIGGAEADAGYSLTFDQAGDVIICGGTQSTDFPVSLNALQNTNAGGDADGFFTKLTNGGQTINYSTYYGSDAYDQLYFTETDEADNLYVFGQTEHPGLQFIFNASYNTVGGGQIITKFSEDLEGVVWSTAFGTGDGQPNISPTAFLVDVCDRIYLSGWGGSTGGGSLGVTGMDVTPDAYSAVSTTGDFYLMVLFDDASDIFYGSFFGGDNSSEHVDGGTSRFSRKGEIYQAVCAGCGSNDDFPIVPTDALSPTNNSNNCNLGVFKFDFQIPATIADFIVPDQICTNQPFTVNNQSAFSQTYTWNFGDDSPTVNGFSPTHTYEFPGIYEITLSVTSAETCNGSDEITKTVVIEDNSVVTAQEIAICQGESVQIGIEEEDPSYTYTWTPDVFLSDSEVSNPIATPIGTTNYVLSIERGACVDTLFQDVEVELLPFTVMGDITLCEGDEVNLEVFNTTGAEVIWSDLPDFSNQLNDNASDLDVTVTVTESSTFYVQLTGGLCQEQASVDVNVFSDFVQVQNDINICAGDTVMVSVIESSSDVSYFWSPSSAVISGNGSGQVQVTASEPLELTVTATSANCEAEDQLTVGVINSSEFEFQATADPAVIIAGGESQLGVTVPGLDYTWSPSGSLNNSGIENPVATPDETTTYIVSGGEDECLLTSQVTVSVVDFICGEPLIFVPNAFSPDGDGQNDVLFVYGQNLTDVRLAIFNRWGQKVFETFDQSEGWDGFYNGKLSDPAVFDYFLEASCLGGAEYFEKGNITLVR
ncbi:MAG: gliding motility-associated C-terminal domain-containing protein [Flavobacteriales bacterium]